MNDPSRGPRGEYLIVPEFREASRYYFDFSQFMHALRTEFLGRPLRCNSNGEALPEELERINTWIRAQGVVGMEAVWRGHGASGHVDLVAVHE